MSALLLHPDLASCRRLFLRGHVLMVHIGAHAVEVGVAQRLRFDVDVYVPLAASTPSADRLDEVVDYDFIRQLIGERLALGHVVLQETLCDDLLRRLLAHPQVHAARVSTEKLDVYPDCESVGCEVFGFAAQPSQDA